MDTNFRLFDRAVAARPARKLFLNPADGAFKAQQVDRLNKKIDRLEVVAVKGKPRMARHKYN